MDPSIAIRLPSALTPFDGSTRLTATCAVGSSGVSITSGCGKSEAGAIFGLPFGNIQNIPHQLHLVHFKAPPTTQILSYHLCASVVIPCISSSGDRSYSRLSSCDWDQLTHKSVSST